MTGPAVPAPRWTKATASSEEGACVEVALLPDGRVAARDSKDPEGPVLAFSPAAFAAFVRAVASGTLASL